MRLLLVILCAVLACYATNYRIGNCSGVVPRKYVGITDGHNAISMTLSEHGVCFNDPNVSVGLVRVSPTFCNRRRFLTFHNLTRAARLQPGVVRHMAGESLVVRVVQLTKPLHPPNTILLFVFIGISQNLRQIL